MAGSSLASAWWAAMRLQRLYPEGVHNPWSGARRNDSPRRAPCTDATPRCPCLDRPHWEVRAGD
jgi:hypothetical protein